MKYVKKVMRLRGEKYPISFFEPVWKKFSLLAEAYGESNDGFLERILQIKEYNDKAPFYLFTNSDTRELIFDELNEISNCYRKLNVDNARTQYQVLNHLMFESVLKIKSIEDILKLWQDEEGKNRSPKISLNLRSNSLNKYNDPLVALAKVCEDCGATFSDVFKDFYFEFCTVAKIINEKDIEQVETNNFKIIRTLQERTLKVNEIKEYKLSTNIFIQFCLFKEYDFNFKFLLRRSRKSRDVLIINFSDKDPVGTLIHSTLPIFCKKFLRSKSEMARMIMFCVLREHSLLNNDFSMTDDFRKKAYILVNLYLLASGKVKIHAIRSNSEIVISTTHGKRRGNNSRRS